MTRTCIWHGKAIHTMTEESIPSTEPVEPEVPVVEAVIIDDDSTIGANAPQSTHADGRTPEQIAKDKTDTERGFKLIAVIAMLTLGFVTGIIPAIIGLIGAIVGFIGSVILAGACIVLVYLGAKAYMRFYNSDFSKRMRARESEKKARKQAKRAARGGLGWVDIAILSAVDGMGSAPSPNQSSSPIPPKTASWDNQAPASNGIDQDAYWSKKQAEQSAYWHRNQASNYANGTAQQHYHDNAAVRDQYRADHTTYR